VPWLQPFPDRLLEDALLAATYAVAVTFLGISRARHRLDSHGTTVATRVVLPRLTLGRHHTRNNMPPASAQANDKFAHLAHAVCRPHSLSQSCA